jgi:hypothetical protein
MTRVARLLIADVACLAVGAAVLLPALVEEVVNDGRTRRVADAAMRVVEWLLRWRDRR